MPDFGSPVAQNVNAGNGLKTVSDLMGLQQQKQQIQSGALGIQRQQAELPAVQSESAVKQLKASQTQQFSKALQSGVDERGQSLNGDDGNPDPIKVGLAAARIAPLAPEIGEGVLKMHTAKIGFQSAALGLDSAQKGALMGPIQSIALGAPDGISNAYKAMDQWEQTHPDMKANADYGRTLIKHIEAVPQEQRAKMANSMAAMLQPGQTVQTQPQAGSATSGQKTFQGTVAPAVAGGGFTAATELQQQPPPTTPVVNKTTGETELYGARPPLVAGSPPVATGMAPMNAANMETATALRKSSNEGAATYQQSQFNNNQIIKLAQDPNSLGNGGDMLAKLTGWYAALPWTSNNATNFNNIGHFMGLQAMTQMKAAGLAGTDSDKALAQSITGDRTYTKESVISIARVNRALSEGGRLYNEGIERAYGTGDPSQVTSFRNQWSTVANVDGLRLYNAKRSGASDPGALSAVKAELGGEGSDKYKAALDSIDNMAGAIRGSGGH